MGGLCKTCERRWNCRSWRTWGGEINALVIVGVVGYVVYAALILMRVSFLSVLGALGSVWRSITRWTLETKHGSCSRCGEKRVIRYWEDGSLENTVIVDWTMVCGSCSERGNKEGGRLLGRMGGDCLGL